jgi:hypothetical protein
VTTENQSVGRDLEELCMRLLDHPHPDGPTSVDLLVGSLPESIAADVPTSPDWRVVGSALYSRGGRPTLMEAVIDAPNSFGEFVGPFQRDCVAIGWSVLEPTGPMHGGFVSAEQGDGRAFRREGQGPVLSIQGVSREGMATDVRLRLDWDAAAYLSRTPHMRPDGAERIPLLTAPAGARLQRQHGGGGSGHWSSESTIRTDWSAGELEAHFAEQLARAGWRRVGGSIDDTVGWSAWQLPGDGNWQGLLLVLAAFRPGERSLTLRVEQSEPRAEEWSGYSVSSQSG